MKLKTTQRILAASVALAFLGTAGQAMAAKVPAGVKLHSTQQIVINNGAEPESLDPAIAESVGANNIARDLFEGLTSADNTGKIVPGIASSWKQTDPTTWVFTLRKNAKWSDGSNVTAQDFVYGILRFLDPKTASTYSSTYGKFILNGKEASEGKKPLSEVGIKAIDAYTLEIKTAFPVPFMPEVVSNPQLYAMHKKSIETHGKDWVKPGKMVTSGAFTLKDWQVNSKIILAKSPTYWDAKNVQLTQVTFLPVEDTNAAVKMFLAGQIDWQDALPAGQFADLKSKYPKEVRNSQQLGIYYYSFQNKDPILKDVRVRKALSMVVDRETLADKVAADGREPAYSIIAKDTKGAAVTKYDWQSWPMDKRVAEAKKLLAAAGVKEGTKLKFAYNTSEMHKKIGIYVASEWKKKLGIDLEMENMEFKVLLKQRHDGQYQVARNGWIADYNDATTFLTLVECESDQNDNKNACNAKAEDLIKKGNLAKSDAERTKMLTEAAQLYMNDYILMPLSKYAAPAMIKSYIGGWSASNGLNRYSRKDLYVVAH